MCVCACVRAWVYVCMHCVISAKQCVAVVVVAHDALANSFKTVHKVLFLLG